MSNSHRFRRWAFGTNFVHLTTASNDIIPVVCRVKKIGDHYTIKFLMDRVILGPRGRFQGSHESYIHRWSIYIAGNELIEFYESEPPQATRTPQGQSGVNFDALSPTIINYIMEKYDLERKVNKPKSTQQEYTGKRLIQL